MTISNLLSFDISSQCLSQIQTHLVRNIGQAHRQSNSQDVAERRCALSEHHSGLPELHKKQVFQLLPPMTRMEELAADPWGSAIEGSPAPSAQTLPFNILLTSGSSSWPPLQRDCR